MHRSGGGCLFRFLASRSLPPGDRYRYPINYTNCETNMKTKVLAAGLVLAIAVSSQVRSERPEDETDRIHGKVDYPYMDLRSTLKEAYGLRLTELKGGGATPSPVIRVSEELYKQERGVRIVGQELAAQERFLARAKEVEAIAESSLEKGNGTRVDYLDAKASRHRAEIELRVAKKSL